MNFQSDNVTGACRPVLDAIVAANDGSAAAYGADDWSRRAEDRIREVFEIDAAVYLVATGTAANSLCLAGMVRPYEGVLCHHDAHINTDECGAPEFFSDGAKLQGIDGGNGKVTPETMHAALGGPDKGVHTVRMAALSISQLSESGALYSLDEIRALADCCADHDMTLHMDGARFANAMVALGCTPAEMSWKAGVRALSFGGTKNGALCAEAVVIFDPDLARDMDRRRKRAGHLFSKMRLLGAQWLAYLEDGVWLENARHANAMAARLVNGLKALPGVSVVYPAQANEIFVQLPDAMREGLAGQGFLFHSWPQDGRLLTRLVTTFNTDPADVDRLVAAARELA